jgi:hypothetical protein
MVADAPCPCPATAQEPATGDYAVVERLHCAKSQPDPGPNGEAFWLGRIVYYAESVSAGLTANPREWQWWSARLAGESACPTIGANPREATAAQDTILPY